MNTPNNTTTRNNNPFGLKTKGSANKKGKKQPAANVVTVQNAS